MATKIDPENQRRINEAKEQLTRAEKELEAAMQALETTTRADKRIIGPILKAAFESLAEAKSKLASILSEPAS
jgi:hypothetical protein